MPCWHAEGVRDVFGFGGQWVGDCEVVVVEVDSDLMEGLEDADNAFDANFGGLLDISGYGKGGIIQGGVTAVGGENVRPWGRFSLAMTVQSPVLLGCVFLGVGSHCSLRARVCVRVARRLIIFANVTLVPWG